MASKEYKEKLKKSDPVKYQKVYGSGLKQRYLDRMKVERPEKYKAVRKINIIDKFKDYDFSIPTELRRLNAALKKYGIDAKEFYRIRDMQNNCCAICKADFSETKLFVDHCHDKGHVRGLLCFNCNVALGHVRDDVKILCEMVKYITN